MKVTPFLFDDRGWTFVETAITVAIILTLSSATGVAAYRYLDHARRAAAQGELAAIGVALDGYALDCGAYPTTEQGLAALSAPPYLHPVPENWNGPYLSAPVDTDPWGRPYVYRRRVGEAPPYELYSHGPPEEGERIHLYGGSR